MMNVSRRQSRIGSGLAAIVTCATMASIATAGQLPEPGIPESVGVNMKTHNWTIEHLQQAKDLGFKVVRRGFYWKVIEPEKGKYDFSAYDEQMNWCHENGIKVLGVFFQGHPEYEDDNRGGIQTEAGRKGFANFAAALAAHYKDHDVMWEIWNEPNVRTFWRKDGKANTDEFAQEYTDLVKEVVPTILKADPDAVVMAGAVSNYWKPSYEWTEFCFKRGILDTGIKAWSVHPYGVKTPEEFSIGHGITRDLLKQYGHPDMPMVNSERGFAVKQSHEGWSGGSLERAREFQSWHFVRQFMMDQINGLSFTIWYEFDGDKFGIMDEGGSRPVHTSAKVMLEQLNGYRFVERIPSDRDLDYLVVFENEAGERKLVAWTCPPAGGSTPDEAVDHVVNIETQKVGSGDMIFRVTSLLGEQSTVKSPLKLTITGAPQYVHLGKTVTAIKSTCEKPLAELQAEDDINNPSVPKEAVNLTLFDDDSAWEFIRNTGLGEFASTRSEKGKPMGVVTYDFTQFSGNGTPYVIAEASVKIEKGAKEVHLLARSPIRQQLTFRLIDSTGQVHQAKTRISGVGSWEPIKISLERKMEHWGGAKDGKIHYPITKFILAVPRPSEDHRIGKVEYADVAVVR